MLKKLWLWLAFALGCAGRHPSSDAGNVVLVESEAVVELPPIAGYHDASVPIHIGATSVPVPQGPAVCDAGVGAVCGTYPNGLHVGYCPAGQAIVGADGGASWNCASAGGGTVTALEPIVAAGGVVSLADAGTAGGHILVSQTTAAWAQKLMSGDCTIAASGAITCTQVNGTDLTVTGSAVTVNGSPANLIVAGNSTPSVGGCAGCVYLGELSSGNQPASNVSQGFDLFATSASLQICGEGTGASSSPCTMGIGATTGTITAGLSDTAVGIVQTTTTSANGAAMQFTPQAGSTNGGNFNITLQAGATVADYQNGSQQTFTLTETGEGVFFAANAYTSVAADPTIWMLPGGNAQSSTNYTIQVDSTDLYLNAPTSSSKTLVYLGNTAQGTVFSNHGNQVPQTTFTSAYTVDSSESDYILLANCASACTLTLPAPTAGRLLKIKDISGAAETNHVSIAQHASESIEGVAASYVLQTNWGIVELTSNGTNWFKVN
jgi:hypothetical protein